MSLSGWSCAWRERTPGGVWSGSKASCAELLADGRVVEDLAGASEEAILNVIKHAAR